LAKKEHIANIILLTLIQTNLFWQEFSTTCCHASGKGDKKFNKLNVAKMPFTLFYNGEVNVMVWFDLA
jgi:hypothetical protein